jgi:molybdate transport system permease protein
MDWSAIAISLKLAFWTIAVLLAVGIVVGRMLAYSKFSGKVLVEALLALPLVLPPTVLGYYLLVAAGSASPLGQFYDRVFGHTLVFSFQGLVIASIVFNLPFAIQPMQRGFEAIPLELREAAACCGMTTWQTFRKVELPLAWPGIVSGTILTFAHTLGEFGVVLMVGGNIPGETKTLAIAIYDRVQAFDHTAAGTMSLMLLLVSLFAITLSYALSARVGKRYG